MRAMEEVGIEKLLHAVDAVNATGNPSYQKVEELLHLKREHTDGATDADGLGQALLDDEFYVQQRDPSDYGSIWDREH
jgi:hypothetical protein